MVDTSKRKNLEKLIRNKENIARNYLKVDNDLLTAILDENKDKFSEIAGNNSDDEFLVNILPEYPEFADELFDVVKNNNLSLIQALKIEREEQARILAVRPKKRAIIPKPTIDKPGGLKAKKNNRQKWNKKEENKIKILLRAGKKPKEIREKINETRLKDDKVLRTDSSINNKIFKIKHKNKRVKR